MVCRVPPNASLGGDLHRGVLSSSTSILNYSHIGIPVKLEPKKAPKFYEVDNEVFHHSTRVVVVQDSGQGAHESARDVCYRSNKGLLGWLYSYMLPQPFFDHRVESYMVHLNQINVQGQGGQLRGTTPEARARGAELHRSLYQRSSPARSVAGSDTTTKVGGD